MGVSLLDTLARVLYSHFLQKVSLCRAQQFGGFNELTAI